ncbi:hypothetical protein F5Y14DRAFT_345509 [Nemania sp. NC0429]|nr:hypothetical protein F5Y14DRAFT_345509 [Nemania sp. NC0429]
MGMQEGGILHGNTSQSPSATKVSTEHKTELRGPDNHIQDTSSTLKMNVNGSATALREQFTPIAICGMACRLPGKISCPEDLWEFLLAKGDARGTVPETRYSNRGHYSRAKKPSATISEHGYFLDPSVNLGALDTSFYSITRGEAERMDPQQRILLEVARESLDDAGEVSWKGANVGVYVGSFGNDWYDVTQRDSQRYGLYQVSTNHDFALSNRLSYEMDLRGPSMTVRTACSSSLICLNEACQAIAKGDCTSAIVGGTNLILAPSLTTDISEQGTLSPDGSCKTFSSAANGYARGEGIVAIYIKALSDAIRDGNPVRAVIVGTATNADGKTPGFSVPSPSAQETLIRRTYEVAGVAEPDIAKTGFFECHGTGTPVGDPIEAESIARIFGQSGVHIGSIKPNLGHGEGASGITAVIKAVLALEHRVIPPNIKSLPRNNKIRFEEARLTVPLEATPWPEDRLHRVSVNSFGVGGANAHAIIDSAERFGFPRSGSVDKPQTVSVSKSLPELLVFSANSARSLKDMTSRYTEYLREIPNAVSLANVAYTLANGREHLPFRTFGIATPDRVDMALSTDSSSLKKPPAIVMVFNGQGSQWAQMGRALLRSNSVFQSTIRSLDDHIKNLGVPLDWGIEKELLKPGSSSRVHDSEFSQPLCTAIQLALFDTLKAFGVQPAAVIGHSSGEIAAAYAAEGLTARDAIAIALLRGQISKTQQKPGSMAAVGLSWKDAEQYLVPGVVVACDNSPSSVTLSGDADKLDEVLNLIKREHTTTQATKLKVNKAYHSHHMVEVGPEYHAAITEIGVTGRAPSIPFLSTVTGRLYDEEFDALYWRTNLESPVMFNTAVTELIKGRTLPSDNLIFLEVGPHGTLAGPLRQIFQACSSGTFLYIPTMIRNQNNTEALLSAIGKLWVQGVHVNFQALMPRRSCVPNLPPYPWDHQRSYWYESRVSREWRQREHAHHDLLGAQVPESSGLQPIWRNILHLDNAPWLRDHCVRKDIVFPLAGYVALAAEAARQISGIQDGVELRHVLVTTALVLHEGKPTEMVTSLNRHRLTDSQDSLWWEFSVTTYNGHTWVKHCSGQVRAVSEPCWDDATIPKVDLPNKVPIRQWYERARRGGSGYGYHFTTIEDLQTSTGGEVGFAQAHARNNWHGDEANYHLHPVVIDTYLQTLCSAAHHGVRHGYKQLIPASVASLSIARCDAEDLTFFASCDRTGDGFVGTGLCVAGSRTVIKVSGVVIHPLAENVDTEGDRGVPITARIEWTPHVDFQSIVDIVNPARDSSGYLEGLELLGQYAICLSQRALSGTSVDTNRKHILQYHSWLAQQKIPALEEVDSSEIVQRKEKIMAELAMTPAAAAARAISQIFDNTRSILSGAKEPVDVLSNEDTQGQLRKFLRSYDASTFVWILGHGRPNLRVLELGAAAGGTTAETLNNLTRPDGQALYSRYVYADVVPGLVTAAQERFRGVKNMTFAVLDIGRDQPDQEFQDEPFDLVIANDVIHTTSSIGHSLQHVRSILKPDGYLLLRQPPPRSLWIKYVLGVLPSWWCGAEDGRPDEPFLSLDGWEETLAASGFRGYRSTISDSSICSNEGIFIIAKTVQEMVVQKAVTVLCNTQDSEEFVHFKNELEARGYRVDACSITDTPPSGQDVIALIDITAPFFSDIQYDTFEQLKRFINTVDSSCGVFWVTKLSQVHCLDPRYASIVGFARTIRSEMGIDFAVCESDDLSYPSGVSAVVNVFCHFRERNADAVPGPDFEFSITHGVTRVPRIFPFSPEEVLGVSETADRAALEIERPGRLDSLHWSAQPSVRLEGNEVEVEVHAAGLNFRDVLIATNIITAPSGQSHFGYEASGVVRRVGPEVKELSIGDRVIVMGVGTFSTVINTSELLCTKIPDGMSFAEAASMPIVFATAIYSLIDVASLEKGQSVLIHSACGGVGLAAIQIAQMLGAEIYTTVGSQRKIEYLMENFNIPCNRIFNSRDDSFVEAVMRETNGKGVDVALNSLSGELLHATWRCVARWGTMVEIGKRDILEAGKLDMGVFLANRSYRCVAIDQMRDERPQIAQSLLRRMMAYFQQGAIRPVPSISIFSGSAPGEAFRYMQEGNHIGKVILSLRQDDGKPDIGNSCTAYKASFALDSTATYLLVGGLGGLGRSVALWMVQHGARYLSFLSRSAGSRPEDEDLVRVLQSMGCKVLLLRGSVSNITDVRQAIDASQAPLKGIVQMSMVLRDQRFSLMSYDDWNQVVQPKILGTWNLHQVTHERSLDLDFFLLFSSLSGILGQPGQANYASANTFLDAFVLYRNSLGLPCTALDVGAMEGAGYLFENQDLMKKMQGTGWRAVEEDELLGALENAMSKQTVEELRNESMPGSNVIVGKNSVLLGISPTIPLSSPDSSARLRKDVRLTVYHNTGAAVESAPGDDKDDLRGFLKNVQANPTLLGEPGTAALFALGIGRKLFKLLLKADQEPDITLGLSELGLDSMVAVEMRAWWKLTFGLEITVLEMLAMGTLEALGKRVVKELAAAT